MRLSGTGTEGATLRLYFEQYQPATGRLDLDAQSFLLPLLEAGETLIPVREKTGRSRADVIT